MTELRTTVLLGAGASRDAGLPLTEALAQELVKEMDDELAKRDEWRRPAFEPLVQALRFVYGAMVGHATELGESPLKAVNVERLISAVRLLRDRRTHEAAPFVAGWKASIEEVDEHPISIADRTFARHFVYGEQGMRTDGVVADIATIARNATAPGDGTTFHSLETELLTRTCRLLGRPQTVDYLRPLIEFAREQPGGLDITTLNYDTTIEMAAKKFGISADTGIDRWVPGRPLQFHTRSQHINLLKVHGSVDWRRGFRDDREANSPDPFKAPDYLSGIDPFRNDDPVMVLGDREKLETDGPTLELMRAFEAALARAAHLVVIGYSFSDRHINTVVQNWIRHDEKRTITILDPGWVAAAPGWERRLFPRQLREALQASAATPLNLASGRVLAVRETAADGLERALHERALPHLVLELTIRVCLDEQPFLHITNHGYDLEHLEITASRPQNNAPYQTIGNLRLDAASEGHHTIRIPSLLHGGSLDVLFDQIPEGAGYGHLHLQAFTWCRQISEHFTIPLRTEVVDRAEAPPIPQPPTVD